MNLVLQNRKTLLAREVNYTFLDLFGERLDLNCSRGEAYILKGNSYEYHCYKQSDSYDNQRAYDSATLSCHSFYHSFPIIQI